MSVNIIFAMIKDMVKEIIDKWGDALPPIAIVPFGYNGMLLKRVLNEQYGIREQYIVDNYLCHYNPTIISVKELCEKPGDICVLLSTTRAEYNREIRNVIGGSIKDIINIMQPPIRETAGKTEYFKKLIKMLKPQKINNFDMVRVGRANDGGYVMCGDFNPNMHAYSFGIDDDNSWDMNIHLLGDINVYMFDHTIKQVPMFCHGLHWERKGIGVSDEKDLLSLASILANNGDLYNRNLILKMDVEGAEWDILESLDDHIIDNFKQMLFEFHNITDTSMQERIIYVLERLNETHQVAWVHGNNFVFAEKDQEILMPDSIEVLYVRRDSYDISDDASDQIFDLDMPNNPLRTDFELSGWNSL